MKETKTKETKAELKDKYLRLYAEFENYKKRAQKEKEEIKITTKVSTLSSILDVNDDLHIASKQIKSEGIDLILSKLESFLKKQGIETIQTETYDPDIHEVISVVPTGDENKIVDVINKGYKFNDKVIRYPKVILGK